MAARLHVALPSLALCAAPFALLPLSCTLALPSFVLPVAAALSLSLSRARAAALYLELLQLRLLRPKRLLELRDLRVAPARAARARLRVR